MPYKKKYVPKRKPRRVKYAKKIKRQSQAYKPRQKKQFQMKRQPFVETKKLIMTQQNGTVANSQINPSDATAPRYREWINQNISPISGFLFIARGLAHNTMSGRDIYSKYLKQKIEIELPTGNPPSTTQPDAESNRPYHRICAPCQFWVVWGWIKRPFGNQNNQDGSVVDVDDVINEIDFITSSGDKLLGSVINNARNVHGSDWLTFKDKRKNIWTFKKKLLRSRNAPSSVKVPTPYQERSYYPNPTSSGSQPGDLKHGEPQNMKSDFGDFQAARGYPNLLQTSIDWKLNRKMRFYPNESGTGGFARDSWIPFSYVLVPKQFQDAVNRASPSLYRYEGSDPTGSPSTLRQYYDLVGDVKVSATSCHWFTDS